MIRSMVALLMASSLFVACSDPELEQRLADLEQKVDTIEKKGVGVGAPGGAPSASSEEEQAAGAMLKEVNDLMRATKFDEAKAKVAELQQRYPNTRAAKSAVRFTSDLNVIGRAETPLAVEKWFKGSEADLANSKAKLYVFWEVWCPHCQREVPKLAETHNKFGKQGLGIVGLTKMSRNVTEDQVNAFIKDNSLPYPIAKEQGSAMSEAYGVQGVPAAALVKDGKVVWRGHPAGLTDEMIQSFLGT